MKTTLLTLAAGLVAFALTAFGQNAPATAQAQGTNRGGPPYAWGDKNKDGICDITGKPVGQGRAARQAGGRQMGRGRGQMRGMCNCCAQNQAPAATPTPAPKK